MGIVIGGDNSESCFVDGFFITKEELEQIKRGAFEAAREDEWGNQVKKARYSEIGADTNWNYKSFNDYLSSKSKEVRSE